jgi:hypothetical protein
MSHGGRWHDFLRSRNRDSYRSWLQRFVRLIRFCSFMETPRTNAAVIAAPGYATPEYVHGDFARELERELAEVKQQLAVNHERAELIIFAREQAIESLQREIVHVNSEWRQKTKTACPKCMGRDDMSQDKATLNWTCIQCGMHWDNRYVQGWNDAKKNEAVCFACRGEGVADHEEGGTVTCSECGGSGVLPNAQVQRRPAPEPSTTCDDHGRSL